MYIVKCSTALSLSPRDKHQVLELSLSRMKPGDIAFIKCVLIALDVDDRTGHALDLYEETVCYINHNKTSLINSLGPKLVEGTTRSETEISE